MFPFIGTYLIIPLALFNTNLYLLKIFVSLCTGKSPFFTGLEDNHLLEDGHLEQIVPSLNSSLLCPPKSPGNDTGERFSRKVFVGGLPPDIDEGLYLL